MSLPVEIPVAQFAPAASPVPRMVVARTICLGAPIMIVIIMIAVFVASELLGLQPFAVAPPENVAEAVTFGDGAQTLVLLRAGQDPNSRWVVAQNDIDARRALRITAIEAAILERRPEFVGLMLRHGGKAEPATRLACLVQAVGIEPRLPLSQIGVPPGRYYAGDEPVLGVDALDACGVPSE